MRVRPPLVLALVLALAAVVRAGDGPEPAKPPAQKAAPAKEEKKAEKPAAPKPAAEPPIASLRPAPRSLEDALRRLANVRVTVSFKEAPLSDVVDYVRRVSGMNVIVAPALAVKGLDTIRPLTLTLTDVSLKQVAEIVNQFSGTKFKFEEGVLQFTTPEDARGKPVLRIYAIGDLTMPLHNFPGPELDLRPANSEFTPEPESDVPSAWSDPEKVVEMIRKLCGEDTWEDKDVSISADQSKLIVRQYPEVHRQIARILGLLQAAR
jgi:hypothetical protein